MSKTIGIIGRIVFWLGLVYIVGHAVYVNILMINYVGAIFSFIFFPITFFLHPWSWGLWWVFVVSITGYIVSTIIGRMDNVD